MNDSVATLSAPSQQHVYLITGATGSLGTQITNALLAQGHKVRAYARNEHRHEALVASVPIASRDRLSSLLGSVEDRSRLDRAIQGCDYVIHAAAQKIVPISEYNPIECVGTNVIGTINVLNACLDAGVTRAVFVSSDKSVQASTQYGITKACGERVWLGGNQYSGGKPPYFMAVRYGNCWDSQGSVVRAFQRQSATGPLSLTSPECTRFHWMVADAVAFVIKALHTAAPGELWVPKLPSYKLDDLATAFMNATEMSKPYSVSGLRTAEKLHEVMISEDESSTIASASDTHYVLTPGHSHSSDRWSYNSGANKWRVGRRDLEELIRETLH